MQFNPMKRRAFIALLGGAAAWPLAARAQQAERMRRIGMLVLYAEGDPTGQTRVAAFRQALQLSGWTEGHNVSIDYRWGTGDAERARTSAADLVTLAPDAIVGNGTAALAALQQATRSIPIVFVAVTDPVGAGYVPSLARPGGNITGFSTFEPEIGGKWLELLREIAPGVRRVAGILDPAFSGFAAVWRQVEATARGFGLEATTVALHDSQDDIEAAVAAFAQQPGGGLIVLPTAINNVLRGRITSLAAGFRLPAIYPFRHYASDGGLLCYGFESIDLWRRGASYVDRVLRGEKPADLPVQAPVKYELAINLKTARALGLDVPPMLLARADEVIE
jgi:putative tryptophan/tyrosine transport system substrate-binding protein